MFRGCSSLTSLDLSNFQIGNTGLTVSHLFWVCPNLEYINLKNVYFKPKNDSQFMSTKKNVVICCEDERIIEEIKKYGCPVFDCSDNWRQNQKKINLENGQCVDNCSETNNSLFNYKNECYEDCPIGTYKNNYICEDCHPDCKTCEKGADIINTNCLSCYDPDKYLNIGNCVSQCPNGVDYDENGSSIKLCKCDLIKCHKCSKESLEQNLCITCNDGYYPKFEDINKNISYIDCYQSPEGYFLDSGFYKSCYESCKICDKGGNNINHNCIECNNNYNYEININGYKNCYIYNNSTNLSKILNKFLMSYEPEKENSQVIKSDEIVYHISNSKNELELLKNRSNNINNISIIDLGECEVRLRGEYHINMTDSLIFVKNEILSNKPSKKNINFDVYELYSK